MPVKVVGGRLPAKVASVDRSCLTVNIKLLAVDSAVAGDESGESMMPASLVENLTERRPTRLCLVHEEKRLLLRDFVVTCRGSGIDELSDQAVNALRRRPQPSDDG